MYPIWKTCILEGLCKRIKRYSKICVKRPLSKRPKIGFQDQSSLHAGQKYCRMLGSILQYFQPSLSYHLSYYLCFVYFWVAVLHRFYCRPFRCHQKINLIFFTEVDLEHIKIWNQKARNLWTLNSFQCHNQFTQTGKLYANKIVQDQPAPRGAAWPGTMSLLSPAT